MYGDTLTMITKHDLQTFPQSLMILKQRFNMWKADKRLCLMPYILPCLYKFLFSDTLNFFKTIEALFKLCVLLTKKLMASNSAGYSLTTPV